jgi:translin
MKPTAKLEGSVGEICKELKKQEEAQDGLLRLSREIVRGCALAIKAVHAGEKKNAEKELAGVVKMVKKARGGDRDLEHVVMQAYQEFAEAEILMAVLEKRQLPTHSELGIPFESYLLGLCDSIGELRREMLEQLKKGKKREAERYFGEMNAIYEAMLPIRFSNSLLPNFRRKQDVARMQVEHARSELLR